MRQGLHIDLAYPRRGFSLVEMMIGMSILVIIAAGTISAIFVSRNLAERNIYDNTAFTVAQGYAEQVKSIEYGLLTNALDNYENSKATVDGWGILDNDAYLTSSLAEEVMLETKSIDASESGIASETDFETESPLYIGAWVQRDVLIDIRNLGENNEHRLLMPMRFKIEMNNLSDTSEDVEALEVTLTYQYQIKVRGHEGWEEGTLRFVICNAPTF